MIGEPHREADDASPAPATAPANPNHIPVSLWVWLAILIATYALPKLMAVQGHSAKIVQESGITAASLQEVKGAELQVRLALMPKGFRQASSDKGEDPAALADRQFRVIAIDKKGVASARKAIVLDHIQGNPLDDAFLTGVLAKNLAEHKQDPGAIGSELALWRSLYSKDAKSLFDKVHVDDTVTRIKKLNLGILEGQVIADTYSLAGREAEANHERKAVQDRAMMYMAQNVLGLLILIMALLTGLVLLIVALVAAIRRKWEWIGRVETPEPAHQDDVPITPSFGSLMDIFVAYLAITRGVGLLVGVTPFFDAIPNVPLTAGVYVGTAALAAVYLWHRARVEGWKLADIGLRSTGKLPINILYGLAAYCAALPLVDGVGLINSWLLKKQDSNLAPNPVLPMIAGESSEIGRFVLFCLVAVAAPIFEELFFRGVLYTALKTRFPIAACIVISGACFAIVHPMGDWLPIFVLGCSLASARELRQGLVPGMVMHFCQNALAFIAMRMMFS